MRYTVQILDVATGEIVRSSVCSTPSSLKSALCSCVDDSINGSLAYNTSFQLVVGFTTKPFYVQKKCF